MPDSVSTVTPFAACAVGDEAFAEAYEALGAARRARLKRCIAVLYESFGEWPMHQTSRRVFRQGFVLEDEDAGPSPAVVIVCDATYPFAGGLLAALMPALAAGARPFVLFRDTGGGIARPLLAALELAGVEDAWLLDEARLADFFRAVTEPGASRGDCADGPARLVLLGGTLFGDELVLEAHRRGVPCRSLFGLPGGAGKASAGFDAPGGLDVLDGADASGAVLFWPHLEPGWFRQCSRRAVNP